MKKVLTGLFLLFLAYNIQAQQSPQYSQYMTNSYLINPALAGTEDYIDLKSGYRNQWTNFEGSPTTMYLTGHSPIGKPHNYYHPKGEHVNWHGVGGFILSDKTGATSITSAYGSYSYNLGVTKGHGFGPQRRSGIRASFGMFVGMQQRKIDAGKLTTIVEDDPVIGAGTQTKTIPDATFGAWLYNDDFYVGLSLQHMFGNKFDFPGLTSDAATEFNKLARHYLLTAGTRVAVSELITFVPSILIKGVAPAPVSVDVNGRLDYNNLFWAGVSYRHRDAISVMAGGIISHMVEIAYSFDVTTTDIRLYSKGTHEVMVGVRILPHDHLRIAEQFWK